MSNKRRGSGYKRLRKARAGADARSLSGADTMRTYLKRIRRQQILKNCITALLWSISSTALVVASLALAAA